jgi:hypothetical protein
MTSYLRERPEYSGAGRVKDCTSLSIGASAHINETMYRNLPWKASMSASPHQYDAHFVDAFASRPLYIYAGLDDAPLILGFEQQLAQQREVDATLRQIAALVDFEFGCLLRGVDPRTVGRG